MNNTFRHDTKTWKDWKQLMFVHAAVVQSATEACTTERHVKGLREKLIISCPPVVNGYSEEGYNIVDGNDCDSTDYCVLIKTNCWYIRKHCWVLDRMNHGS